MYLRELEHELSHRHNEPDHQAWKYREGLAAPHCRSAQDHCRVAGKLK
jgi:hypothetical protein